MRIAVLIISLVLFVSSCASTTGVFHTVGRGETLWRICKTYDVDMQEVAELNNIRDETRIRAGQRIFIPGVARTRDVEPIASAVESARSAVTAGRAGLAKPEPEGPEAVAIEKGRFDWPVRGEVVGEFGVMGQTRHDGIDIKAERGTAIKASDAGVVAHTDDAMRLFGKVVILRHEGDFYTVYAHNDENLVKTGDKVEKGGVIGKVGSTGEAGTAKLHFEIRDGQKVRNPLFFLP
jgi:lipoprotein NlpD